MRLLLIGLLTGLVAACGGDDSRALPDGGAMVRTDSGGGGRSPENTAETCQDMVDNDGDELIDCEDTGCASLDVCTSCIKMPEGTDEENTMELCSDGVDNDCDGRFDCRENSCREFCGVENTNAQCSDGIDNDNDGVTDCEDFDCFRDAMDAVNRIVCVGENTNARCSDGEDNDGDSMTDCMDPDCQGEAIVVCDGTSPVTVAQEMWPALIEERCTNGVSEGESGADFVDCADFSCAWNFIGCDDFVAENTNATCSNGEDDDKDGLADCDDPGCQREGIVVCDPDGNPVEVDPAEFVTLSNAQCSNGENEDGDMGMSMGMEVPRTDCGDFDCTYSADADVCRVDDDAEATNELCSDGMDNDGDDFIDCRDFSCRLNPAVTVCESFERCSDGIDNDGDGRFDCGDFDCTPRSGAPNACRSLTAE